MAEFKQCPNGHYYQGATCPYCKTSANAGSSNTSGKTEVFGGGGFNPVPPTEPVQQPAVGGGNKTVIGGGGMGAPTNNPNPSYNPSPNPSYTPSASSHTYVSPSGAGASMSSRTVFGDDVDLGGGQSNGQPQYRSTRKLVGWLVTYSLDPMGADFKLYEGRNIIGRSMDCNITVNDNMISSEHAVILFRSGKYSITDKQSSHGTFVNDVDIDLDPYYLNDGDTIKIGKTVFKFKTSF